MEPTISQGQTVLVSAVPYLFSKPKIGDIVAFKKNEKVFIKRINKIDPSADGEKYFVSGDNKNDSFDSRRFGWITKENILGKVV